jgi:hypothetical protein
MINFQIYFKISKMVYIKVAEYRQKLKELGLSTEGTRVQLINRLESSTSSSTSPSTSSTTSPSTSSSTSPSTSSTTSPSTSSTTSRSLQIVFDDESDSDSSTIEEEYVEENPRKIIGRPAGKKNQKYIQDSDIFKNRTAIEKFIESEDQWRKGPNHTDKQYYRCKAFDQGCRAGLYIYSFPTELKYQIFRSETAHSCENVRRGIHPEVSDYIISLLKQNITQRSKIIENIVKTFKDRRNLIITPLQYSSFISRLDRKIYGPTTTTYGFIDEWC